MEALDTPPKVILREGGGNFLIHDSGPGENRISMFGRERNNRSLAHADVWGADGTFKVCHRLWCHLYTVRAVSKGYSIPCVYALLPNKPQGKYDRMWGVKSGYFSATTMTRRGLSKSASSGHRLTR